MKTEDAHYHTITETIHSSLNEVFGETAISSLLEKIYDPGQPQDLWCLEALAGAHSLAKALTFTTIQRAELCSLLWNERMTPAFDHIAFEVISLSARLVDVELVWDEYTKLLDARLNQ